MVLWQESHKTRVRQRAESGDLAEFREFYFANAALSAMSKYL
jgi:hypothetical protein